MKKFLTSSIILGLVVSPAIADTLYKDTNIGDSCTADFLGSDSGNAANSFLAQYTPNDYPVSAGQYLAKNGTSGTQCPANSYCAGGTFTFSETADSGITACPDEYGLSAAGASAQTECYRTCTTNDVAHSTAVSGGYYYGDNNQCGATACAMGWHIKQGVDLTEMFGGKPTGGTFVQSGVTITEYAGNEGVDGAYIRNDGVYNSMNYSGAGKSQSYYGISEVREWGVAFDNGFVKGRAICSTQSGVDASDGAATQASEVTTVANLTDETGQEGAKYCYCNLTGYGDSDGNITSLSSPWVFVGDPWPDASYCVRSCENTCVGHVRYTYSDYLVFRAALFGSVSTSGPAVCEANEITITWKPANGQADITNTCTYSGDITLPTAPEKTGYSFSGWKLVTGSSN